MKYTIQLTLKGFFKTIGYFSIIRDYLFKVCYKLINNWYPNHIVNIKIIDTQLNKVYIHGNNLNTIDLLQLHNPHIFYVINIWNKELCKNNYYIINNTLFNQLSIHNNKIQSHLLISNLLSYNTLIDNNIFAITIFNKDVTHVFEKYFKSISIPNNVTAHALYLYYCYKYHIQPVIQNSSITIINYDLIEKTFNYNDIINCDL